ncbi:5,6-dimethylbenzimidazole synthase [Phycicoccus sp. CSK15P-2]|nr:5,6-dimethylbenzimidazole synthase [Phycicoccus sp. CSK15P-2]
MGPDVVAALGEVVAGRRDIRRFRPDPVPDTLLTAVLEAGHRAPSVGHSQPWRFVVVRDASTRDRAAALADAARLRQAEVLTEDRAARLLDLKLEGLREAPVGVVVACDRRTPAAGVLGRATFPDTDMWSCATAVQNMWLTARALGLGMGWVTLFEPADLAGLLGLPDGVETLGWLCLGWPDERPPEPGLQRAAWSKRAPLADVVLHERWPDEDGGPAAPVSHLRGPSSSRLVGATDAADAQLAAPEALGVLDRVVARVRSLGSGPVTGGTLVLAAADHPVAGLGVSAFPSSVTRDVALAAVAGESAGVLAARGAGLGVVVVDAGVSGGLVPGALDARPVSGRGDLVSADALAGEDVDRLVAAGVAVGRDAAASGVVVLGEVGIGNTTVAAALAAALVGLPAEDVVGLGVGADAETLERKRTVVAAALERVGDASGLSARALLAALGGGEVAVLTGVVLGAARAGAAVVLDGLAASVPALLAVREEPAVQAHLVAGQRSREKAHAAVLRELGLEPVLALRLRAGEGVGGCLAASLVLQSLHIRTTLAVTQDPR